LNAKIERVNKDIDKTKDKINEFQARLKELEKQKTELENTEIVEAVRGMDIPLNDLPAILKALREQNGAPFTSGQLGPKFKDKTDSEKEENMNEENS
jgi:septal ring factor EnvC (AmiA/AmiB activator)